MGITDEKLKEILLSESYIDEEDAQKAEANKKIGFKDSLLQQGIITKDLIGQAVSEYYDLQYADLNIKKPTQEQVLLIPESIAKKYRIVFFSKTDDNVIIATDNPEQKGINEIIKGTLKIDKYDLAFSLSEDIENIFLYYRKSLDTRFSKIIKSEKRVAPDIIDEIIKDAVTLRASDIHLEPQENRMLVRFRIDGVLQEAGQIDKRYYDNIVNRIKIQAKMRIDEHKITQDGAIRFQGEEEKIDIRVSIAPALDGEKIVMRLLSKSVQSYSLSDIGLNENDYRITEYAIKKPFGMVLVTGPTGSGKTTTLYSFLRVVNKPEINITTIEDPVELRVEGINQLQINKAKGFTFAKGLRSILRQDPDVILVGEIRDNETSEIAVNAALTGHLLFSTFHANNASTAIPRLLDMGIEPFLLASTLELIISQRLARKICTSCRQSTNVSSENIKKLPKEYIEFFRKNPIVYKGAGCPSCNHTGYNGRVAIFEVINNTSEIQQAILKNSSSQELWEIAKSQGSKSLFEDGLIKIKTGKTTLEELLRIAPPSKTTDSIENSNLNTNVS